MIPISSALSGGLLWSRISCRHGSELRQNGEVVGSLRRTSFWSSNAEAESLDGKWLFRRTGFLCASTEIVDAVSASRIAILKPNWTGGGSLVFSDGQTFRVASRGLWQNTWEVTADNGQPILRTNQRKKTVELLPGAAAYEGRLTLLVLFTRHMVQQASEDAAASVAATVAVTG